MPRVAGSSNCCQEVISMLATGLYDSWRSNYKYFCNDHPPKNHENLTSVDWNQHKWFFNGAPHFWTSPSNHPWKPFHVDLSGINPIWPQIVLSCVWSTLHSGASLHNPDPLMWNNLLPSKMEAILSKYNALMSKHLNILKQIAHFWTSPPIRPWKPPHVDFYGINRVWLKIGILRRAICFKGTYWMRLGMHFAGSWARFVFISLV